MTKIVNWKIAGWDGYRVYENGRIKYFKVGNQSKNMDEEIETGEDIKDEPEESGEELGDDLPDDESDFDDEEDIEMPGDES